MIHIVAQVHDVNKTHVLHSYVKVSCRFLSELCTRLSNGVKSQHCAVRFQTCERKSPGICTHSCVFPCSGFVGQRVATLKLLSRALRVWLIDVSVSVHSTCS